MTEQSDPNRDDIPKRQWFVTTCWTNLLLARKDDSPEARQALEDLCRTYWYPLYAYARRRGYPAADAEDVTQAFFHELLEKDYLGGLDRDKGKFRSFLLVALNHFISKDRARKRTQKRGGGEVIISLDEFAPEERYRMEPVSDLSPVKAFEIQWAETLIHKAQQRLAEDYRNQGKAEVLEALRPYLAEEAGTDGYEAAAQQLKMRPKTVAVMVHRMRKRYRDLVRDEITRTVGSPEEVEEEMQHLLAALKHSRG